MIAKILHVLKMYVNHKDIRFRILVLLFTFCLRCDIKNSSKNNHLLLHSLLDQITKYEDISLHKININFPFKES